MSCAGLLLLGCGSALDSDALTTAALLVLGLAGPGVFNGGYLGGLQLIPEEQAKTRATLASCLAAVFDGSSLVFVLLRALAVALGHVGHDLRDPALVEVVGDLGQRSASIEYSALAVVPCLLCRHALCQNRI